MKIKGIYAHRFSGFVNSEGMPCYLVGLGTIAVYSDGTISGNQTSSTTRLKGSAALIEVGTFELSGKLLPKPPRPPVPSHTPRPREALITFTKTGGNGAGPKEQVLKGTFSLVPCGSVDDPTEKLWLISTGAHNDTENSDADEVVSGEAVRIATLDD